MAGLFPQGGVTAQNTLNAATGLETTPGCDPLFHPARCIPRFDPAAANAVISEILNAINVFRDYDCSRLDNLALALNNLKSLCSQPTIESPDTNDFLAGCFDGVSGKVSVQSILDLAGTLCSLPISETPDTNDHIIMCVDGVDSRVPIMNVLALTPTDDTIAGLFRDTTFIAPGSDGGTATLAVADITWPRMMRVSVARQSYSNGKPTYFRVNTTDTDNTETEAIFNGGAYQFYTFIPALGGIFRMEGMHLSRKVIDCLPTEEIYLSNETDETSFSSWTSCLASPVPAA